MLIHTIPVIREIRIILNEQAKKLVKYLFFNYKIYCTLSLTKSFISFCRSI